MPESVKTVKTVKTFHFSKPLHSIRIILFFLKIQIIIHVLQPIGTYKAITQAQKYGCQLYLFIHLSQSVLHSMTRV
jgi:hypothetical protein